MAKIYGISLKKVNYHFGHEGETLVQCDIYVDGKKVGYFNEVDYGGCNEIVITPNKTPPNFDFSKFAFERNTIKKEILRRESAYMSNARLDWRYSLYPDGTEIIFSILELMEQEAEYKKMIKAGEYEAITFFEAGGKQMICRHVNKSKEDIELELSQNEDAKNPKNFRHFFSLDDFIIKEKI